MKSSTKTQHFFRSSLSYLLHNKIALFAIFVLLFMILGAIFIPIFSPIDYAVQNVAFANKPPLSISPDNGLTHLFGTDELGRDIFVRMWYGARISLTVAIAVALIDCLIGVFYGGISGYLGGKTDVIMMRILEIISGIPYLIIVLLLSAIFPRGLVTLIIAYSIAGWTGTARLIRGQVISLCNQEYVIAAKVMGAGTFRIITRHLIPNLVSILIINITLDIPGIIFTESFLSLMGLGIAPPQSSWGIMINQGIKVFQTYSSQLIIPAVFICLTTLSFNLLGDKLRDAFDPKARR